MLVELATSSAVHGDLVVVRLTDSLVSDYDQVQLDVVDVAVRNPTARLSFGTAPRRVDIGIVEVQIDTSLLVAGLFEVGLIRLHTPVSDSGGLQRDFVPRRDFERQLFEIRHPGDSTRDSAELRSVVEEREREIAEAFATPIDVRSNKSEDGQEYLVLVFVRDVLIGVAMLVDSFQIVPTGTGLDGADSLRFVNDFLAETTPFGVRFDPDEASTEQARLNNPVFVLHFPAIRANSTDEARDHCVSRTEQLLLALALSRDAGGTVFEVVVMPKGEKAAIRYGYTGSYVGNRLLGSLSGESAAHVEALLRGLETSSMNRFLVSLYREALRERSPDFRYVRFWQILETMADSRNYDARKPLLNYEGHQMMDGNRPLQVRGSVHSVFNLLRENSIGDTVGSWKNVNVWYAFRCAAAHYGAVARYAELSHASTVRWGSIGFEELQSSPGFDPFLFMLKEEAKFLLMKRLTDASSFGVPSNVD